ncbi:MAG: PepSY domain-containing protein [Acidobacteria bacterium]|nr:PepSY domain-containing protein [Acidobacteriota bacterium]
MAILRRILFWCHLACGVAGGVVILIMCVTGVALTYQKEMQFWADTRHFRATPGSGDSRAPVSSLLAAARAVDADAPVTTITWRSDPSAPAALAIGPQTVYVNPYSAEVYGEGTGQRMRAFFTSMTNWHRWLAMSGEQRPTGRALTGAANLMFLFVVLSGVYLWWPRTLTWTQFRNVLWFKRGVRAKARDFNWHNVIGFWSAIPLAIVVYSGTVISYPWSSDLVYRAMGEDPPAPAAGRGGGPGGPGAGGGRGGGGRGGRAGGEPRPARGESASMPGATERAQPAPSIGSGVDDLVARAMQFQPGWQMLALRVPASERAPVVFTIDQGDAGQPNRRGTLTLDASTGAVQKWEDFSAQTPGRRMRTWLRFAHTGEIYGFTGQTIAGLVSAGGAVLVYTGLALALRRFLAWRKRIAKKPGFAVEQRTPVA